jgi:hypothetical protein
MSIEPESLEGLLARLRGVGWMVGVHNDYRLKGEFMTFWLFTNTNGTFLKGEGRTDLEALRQVVAQLPVPKLHRCNSTCGDDGCGQNGRYV